MRYNALESCATRVCRTCIDETTCVAERYPDCEYVSTWEHTVLPYGRKNPLPFLFSKRSPVSNLRQTLKGKGRFTRGWKPQVSTLLCPRRVGALPAEVQRKHPARQGRTRSRSSRAPVSRCRETGCRPAGTYESLRLNSSYPNIRTTSSVPSARRMAISGSGIPLNVLVLTMV